MRIELNTPPVPVTSVGRPVSALAGDGGMAVQSSSADRVTLGSSGVTVQSLTAQAMSTPAIRQDKVAALQSAIRDRSYQVDPTQIASAMISSGDIQG